MQTYLITRTGKVRPSDADDSLHNTVADLDLVLELRPEIDSGMLLQSEVGDVLLNGRYKVERVS